MLFGISTNNALLARLPIVEKRWFSKLKILVVGCFLDNDKSYCPDWDCFVYLDFLP